MENIEIIYYFEITITDDITNCYNKIKSQLEYISKYLRNKIHIILSCNLIDEIEYFCHMINIVLRKGNGIGKNVRCITYNLYLIENKNKPCFLKTIKNICNKENNINIKYLCIDSKFIDINELNIYIECINNIQNSPNVTDIFTVNYTDNKVPYIFYVGKKYIDKIIHYDEIFIKPKIFYLDETIRSSKLEEFDIYQHFNNKYNIEYYDTNLENSTKLNELIEISVNKEFNKITDIENIDSFILIIDFPKLGGGTTYFLTTLIEKYKYHQTFIILRNIDNNQVHVSINDEYMLDKYFTYHEIIDFIQNNINKLIKIFVNHTIKHPDFFIENLFNFKKEITYITHDYYSLFTHPQPIFQNIEEDKYLKKNIYINKFDKIITQNISNLYIFEKHLENKKNIIITELPDYKKSKKLYVTNNEKIIVGFIGCISDIKGKKFIISLNEYVKKNNLNIEIVIFGYINSNNIKQKAYNNIDELNNLLIEYKPNLLIDASIWPETYSYSLTLMMLTQLPILSIEKQYCTIKNRLEKYNKSSFFENLNECIELIFTNKQDYFYTIEPTIYFNSFWDNYFITNKEKYINIQNVKYNIKPYLIYFPQFNRIEENDKRFYEGFNDVQNLKILETKFNNNEIEIPNFKELNINNFEEYNLTNENLIKKQIELLDDYNINGLAIYYYWFSTNNITGQNMVMKNSIDQFFYSNINLKNKKVFFIWANENWTNNAAFGKENSNNEYDISNVYNIKNIKNNVTNLICYFKHNNYLKIDNKPVFFIYHPFYMNNDEIDLFYNELNKICILNKFSGVHMVLNSFTNINEKYKKFYINFNYKNFILNNNNKPIYYKNSSGQQIIDYNEYINCENNYKKCIQTVVFDFDNRARLINPNKLNKSSICKNNTEYNTIKFINKIVNNYRNKIDDNEYDGTETIDKILLINSLNEWGEKMTFEPSRQYKYYNINLLCNHLFMNEQKNIVLVNSKIIVSDKPFSYSNYRSIYSTDERFKQTLETIASIRKNIPSCYIVLIDNSKLEDNIKECLNKKVDKLINITDDDNLNYYTDDCVYKAFGDISQQIKFFDVFLKNVNFNKIKNLFKISGRYLINDEFDYSLYDNNYSIIKKNKLIVDKDYYFTCFYKLNKDIILNYFNELKNIIENQELYKNMDCEVILGDKIKKYGNFKEIDNLGITQKIAIKSECIDKFNNINI